MPSTSFTNGVTLTDDDWFNDLNRLHYTIFGDPTNLASAQAAFFSATVGAAVALGGTLSVSAKASFAALVATGPVSASSGEVFAVVLATEQAATSGTTIDFTGIPAWAKKIVIQFFGVSTNGTSNPLIQLGDSGGVETSGYLGTGSSITAVVSSTNYTAGFGIPLADAANVIHGSVTLTLEDATQFTWICSGVVSTSNTAASAVVSGSKSTSAALDRVRITTVNGTDAFDAGAINILYE